MSNTLKMEKRRRNKNNIPSAAGSKETKLWIEGFKEENVRLLEDVHEEVWDVDETSPQVICRIYISAFKTIVKTKLHLFILRSFQ